MAAVVVAVLALLVWLVLQFFTGAVDKREPSRDAVVKQARHPLSRS